MKYGIYINMGTDIVFLILVLFLSVNANAQAPSDHEVTTMEKHWSLVTNEPDEKKRRELVDEHRRIMSGYASMKIPKHDGPMGDMHNHDREMHIQNTVDMHTHMMDMMQ